ncbi:MAG: phospholipid carrier-dependent glycosyltransferase [Actinomycetota bacterium]|nr:phospholipid carrier-dependent glycosyltransferase [Actinomycetota bacterium]
MLLPTQTLPRGDARQLVRRHAGLVAVLVAGVLLRVGAELAYRPALFFSDSWVYLSMASRGAPVALMPSRPGGYPLLLRLLAFPGHDMLLVTVAQHLAGLAVGILVYMMLLHVGLRRPLAALASALVMLNPSAIALEQFLMAEALFTLLLVAAIALTMLGRASRRALMLAGGLLGVACTLRTSALFVIPVWLIYLLWTAGDRRRVLSGAVGLMAPLLLYTSWNAIQTGGSFGFDQMQGWFLYGRIAQIADCNGATIPASSRRLCVPVGLRHEYSPGDWIWIPASPPDQMTGGNPDFYAGKPGGAARAASNNRVLQDFAIAIIRAHPLAYARTAASDFLRFFDPAAIPPNDPDGLTVTFPSAPLLGWLYGSYRDRYLPGYVPRVRWPAPLLVQYQKRFPDPRLLLGVLSIVALIALLAPILSRGRLEVRHRAEIFLLMGSGIAMLLASAAFVAFVVRYLIPAVPLLISGGILAVNELLRLRAYP